jgi:hypothetical protein
VSLVDGSMSVSYLNDSNLEVSFQIQNSTRLHKIFCIFFETEIEVV